MIRYKHTNKHTKDRTFPYLNNLYFSSISCDDHIYFISVRQFSAIVNTAIYFSILFPIYIYVLY